MALKHILGDLPVIKILDFFIENHTGDHTRAEIAHYTEAGPSAMKRDFPLLVRCGVVIETRRVAGVPLYALDTENEMTQSLIRFDDELTEYCTDKILGGEVATTEAPIDETERTTKGRKSYEPGGYIGNDG